MGDGPSVEAGREERVIDERRELNCIPCDVRPMFPVGEASGAIGNGNDGTFDDELCAPCEEEEQAEMPLCLPAVYQPAHSEFLDHCVTHYPYRAWCKYCVEGRGRELGHDASRGNKRVSGRRQLYPSTTRS